MSTWPWLVGGGLAAYLWSRSDHRVAASPAPARAATAPNTALPGRWVLPLPRYAGRGPAVSDGVGSARPNGATHGGVDLMYERASSDTFRAGTPNATARFVMPDGVLVLAASDGEVESVLRTPRGIAVVIDHKPHKVKTFYQHLGEVFVGGLARVPASPRVKAGQPIGIVGFDPQDPAHLKHLHFEVWLGGPSARIDPQPLMASWSVLDPVAPPRNARRGDIVSVVAHSRSWPGTSLRKR